jgi:hypothetical protein
MGQQIEELENESDFLAPHQCPSTIGQGGKIASSDGDFAPGWDIDARCQVKQRGFSTSTSSHNGHFSPGRNVEGDFSKGKSAFSRGSIIDFADQAKGEC